MPPVVEYLPDEFLPSKRPSVRHRLTSAANDADALYVVNGGVDGVNVFMSDGHVHDVVHRSCIERERSLTFDIYFPTLRKNRNFASQTPASLRSTAFAPLKRELQNISRMKKTEAIRNAKTFDELLDIQYGKIGERERDDFEERAQYFVISETLKSARREANLTQQQLADKVGTKKSYISRLENGKCDIQLSTLYRIFEDGLGRRVSLLIA